MTLLFPGAMKAETFSGTRFPAWYFIAQAVGIAGWWLYLLLRPAERQLFIPPGASELELFAFALPDLAVAVPTSLAAGGASLRGARWTLPLAWTATGAVIYAFAYCVAWSLIRHGGWTNVLLMAPAALLSSVAAIDASAGTVVLFRKAAARSPSRHVLATLGQIAFFWSLFLVVVPLAIKFVEAWLGWTPVVSPVQAAIAVVLFLLFSALGLASGITIALRGGGMPLPFDATNRLVVTGPYGYLRNPMVVAGLGQALSVGIWIGSWAIVTYMFVGGLIWQFLVRPAEERDLAQVFGETYVHYRDRVRCWVPHLRPFKADL
jgi:protein-S-isoprenylcysteine O-methyltransferase Ste14